MRNLKNITSLLKDKELLSYGAQIAPILMSLPLSAVKARQWCISSDDISWENEKQDILQRANWLCRKIIKENPEALLKEAPEAIGEHFQGEWAIYCCSMLSHALANIAYIYPDKKDKCPDLIARMIEIVNTPTIRKYDTDMWGEDAMETLSGCKSHMTYLSILAWMISNFKLAGGDCRYDSLYGTLCDTLVRRMKESPYDLNLLSFPNMQIWLPDMLVSIVAIKNYSRLNDGKYSDVVDAWLHNAKTKWIDKKTGLLAGMLPGESSYQTGMKIRGSHSALNCSYLSLVDADFAKEQYEKMCQVLRKDDTFMGTEICGVKEYLNYSPELKMAPGDAGLVVKGISAGGTAFALGAATFFEDWEFRAKMLKTAEVAGGTKKEKGMRHYNIADIFLVGEATALAMRTNIDRYTGL